MKKIFVIGILVILISRGYTVEYKIDPEKNSLKSIQSLLKDYRPGEKHRVSENIELFKKFLVGTWDAGDWGKITFYKNGSFRREEPRGEGYLKYGKGALKYKYKGIWKVENNTLLLEMNSAVYEGWKKYKIEYFSLNKYTFDHIRSRLEKRRLEKEYEGLNRYSLDIITEDGLYASEGLFGFSITITIAKELDPREKKK